MTLHDIVDVQTFATYSEYAFMTRKQLRAEFRRLSVANQDIINDMIGRVITVDNYKTHLTILRQNPKYVQNARAMAAIERAWSKRF